MAARLSVAPLGALGLIAAVLSLQPGHGYWVPWALIKKLPWIGDVVEVRFTLILTLCVAAMVAITIDRFRSWLIAHHPQLTVLKSDALMAALAVLVLLPTALAMWPNVPLTAQAVVLPRWYAEVGSRLPPARFSFRIHSPFLACSLLRPGKQSTK